MGPWGPTATPAEPVDDERCEDCGFPLDVDERPCGCRTENGVFMPCADHVVSDLRT